MGRSRELSKLPLELLVDANGRVQINGASGAYTVNVLHATDAFLGLVSGSGLPVLIGQDGNGDGYVYNSKNATLRFGTNNTERARLDASGNLLVGRTSNLGASRFVVEADTTSTNPMTVSNSRSTAATDYSILFYRNASLVGSIQTTLSATSYVTSSDYRLKDDVAPMTGALSKVAALKPVTYKWKSTGEASQGFIAHELQEVVPECVTGQKDAVDADGNPIYQGIDTSFLVATLTAAIQELKAELDALRAQIG